MHTNDDLHWEITPAHESPVTTSNWAPTVTFYRTVEGHGNVRSNPFTKEALIAEIEIKKNRGDHDISPWQEALSRINQILH